MLALSFARWLRDEAGDDVEVLAFRAGPLAGEARAGGPLVTVLDDEEAWSVERTRSGRGDWLRARLAGLAAVDVNLLVSVAAGQALPLVAPTAGPVVTWVVEVGDDLHWVRSPGPFDNRETEWLAGSDSSARALAEVRPDVGLVRVVPEFVDSPPAVAEDMVATCRQRVGAGRADVVVVGAGIGTRRKGLDLFLEVAALLREDPDIRPVWVGGECDPLWDGVGHEIRRLGLDRVTLVPSTPDLAAWIRAAGLFLHTARLDAFPLVCLHAASAAVPVVAMSGTGGTVEMFRSAFCGPPYPDIAAVAQEIRRLAGDPAERQRIGAAQRAIVAGRHLTTTAAPLLRRAVLDAVGGSRRR